MMLQLLWIFQQPTKRMKNNLEYIWSIFLLFVKSCDLINDQPHLLPHNITI